MRSFPDEVGSGSAVKDGRGDGGKVWVLEEIVAAAAGLDLVAGLSAELHRRRGGRRLRLFGAPSGLVPRLACCTTCHYSVADSCGDSVS